MGKVSPLHRGGSLTMPLADGASLRLTPFRESARLAVTFHGPRGGDAGGAVLTAKRARLLASWLVRLADQCGVPAARPARPRVRPGHGAAVRDRDAALGGLARLAVSVLADWCSIDVVEGDGSLRRLPVVHADLAKSTAAKKLRSADTTVATGGRRTSSLTVPLSVRGRTLGVMTFGSAGSRRRYAEADLLLARELGRLAGLVLETPAPFAELPAPQQAKGRAPRPGPVRR